MTHQELIEKTAGKTIASVEAHAKTDWMDELGEITLTFSDGSKVTITSSVVGYEFGAMEVEAG